MNANIIINTLNTVVGHFNNNFKKFTYSEQYEEYMINTGQYQFLSDENEETFYNYYNNSIDYCAKIDVYPFLGNIITNNNYLRFIDDTQYLRRDQLPNAYEYSMILTDPVGLYKAFSVYYETFTKNGDITLYDIYKANLIYLQDGLHDGFTITTLTLDELLSYMFIKYIERLLYNHRVINVKRLYTNYNKIIYRYSKSNSCS